MLQREREIGAGKKIIVEGEGCYSVLRLKGCSSWVRSALEGTAPL